MPVAKIQTPNGIITLEVPEGATEEDILAFVQQQDQQNFPPMEDLAAPSTPDPLAMKPSVADRFNQTLSSLPNGQPDPTAPIELADPTRAQAFGRSFASTAGLGIPDAMAGLQEALIGRLIKGDDRDFLTAYEEGKGEYQEPMQAYPGTSMAGAIPGGIMTGSALTRGAGLLRGAMTGAGEGAMLEGLRGSPEDIGGNMARGAAMGGAMDLSGNLGLRSAGLLARKVQDVISGRGMSGRYMAEALKRAGLTFDEAQAALRTGDGRVLADLDPELQRLLATMTEEGGEGTRLAQLRMLQRTEGQAGRLNDFAAQHISPVSAGSVAERFKALRDEAAPLYQQAYAEPIQLTDKLTDLLQKPAAQGHLKGVIDALDNASVDPALSKFTPAEVAQAKGLYRYLTEGDKPGKALLYDAGGNVVSRSGKGKPENVSMRLLHVLSQRVNDRVNALSNAAAGTARSGTEAGQMKIYAGELADYMKTASPSFRAAQEHMVPVIRAEKAYALGQDLMGHKGTAADIKQELDDLVQDNPTVKQYFNAGVRDALDRLGMKAGGSSAGELSGTTTGDITNLLTPMRSEDMKQRVGLALDNAAGREAFDSLLQREGTMFSTDLAARGGQKSIAAEDIKSSQEIEAASARVGAFPTGFAWAAWIRALLRGQRAEGYRRTANELADDLTSPAPKIRPGVLYNQRLPLVPFSAPLVGMQGREE